MDTHPTKIILRPPVSMLLLCLSIHIILPQSILHSWLLIVANNILILAMLVGLLAILSYVVEWFMFFIENTPFDSSHIIGVVYLPLKGAAYNILMSLLTTIDANRYELVYVTLEHQY